MNCKLSTHQGWKRVVTHEAVNANSKKVWQTRESEKKLFIESMIGLMMTVLTVVRQVEKMKEQHRQAQPSPRMPPT